MKKKDYAAAYADFDLAQLQRQFHGSFATGINACVECCDRWAQDNATALNYIGADGSARTLTFVQLQGEAARFANLLRKLGVKPGDVVAGMLPRVPELLVTILGTWRAGAVYQPLFTAFGPKAIEQRLATSNARLVVTDPSNRPKLDGLPMRPQIAVVRRAASDPLAAGDLDFAASVMVESDHFTPVLRKDSDLFLLMSTSGTTGMPKGVPVPLHALLSMRAYMVNSIDLRPRDKFWNIADPGWAYGLYYAVTGPLLLGHATTFYDGPFTVESTYGVIERLGITNLAGAPTAFRLLIAAGAELATKIKGRLRVVSSAGEPLNPEVIRWFEEVLGAPIRDHYGQTETGMTVCNHHALDHKMHQGSAGRALPGYKVAVLDEAGHVLGPHQPGVLAIDMAGSPLHFFHGYLNQPTPAIAGGWYRTGDSVELEPDGTITFVGRSDDIITSAGYRIGPFEVESALIEHGAVVESAVVGKPDRERTEIVKAFVVLKPEFTASPALAADLQDFVKKRLSAHAFPREIEFVTQLPKTPSGKLQRFILRDQEIAKARA
ncbi:MAG: AMP-binding protein [Hyphomicrobiales bacterium]|nr:AMP-binding protein [Hyphomicrobiales bacterium]